MATQAETVSTTFDTLKLVLAVILLLAGVGGYYYFAELSVLYRALGVIGLSVAALFIVLTTARGRDLWAFFRESRAEVRRMVWPTRQETVQMTLIVFALVFLVGLILWLLDMLLFWGVTFLTGQGA
ncbi:MAG: preprotein translocase subunit SecE [Methylotetracoccus sp.]